MVLGDVHLIMPLLYYVQVEGTVEESLLSFKPHFKSLLRYVYSTLGFKMSLNVIMRPVFRRYTTAITLKLRVIKQCGVIQGNISELDWYTWDRWK